MIFVSKRNSVTRVTLFRVTLKQPVYKMQYQEISVRNFLSQKLLICSDGQTMRNIHRNMAEKRRSISRLLSEKVGGLFYHFTKLLACGKDTISPISGISAIPEQMGIQALVA
jgi:hypothetical protein